MAKRLSMKKPQTWSSSPLAKPHPTSLPRPVPQKNLTERPSGNSAPLFENDWREMGRFLPKSLHLQSLATQAPCVLVTEVSTPVIGASRAPDLVAWMHEGTARAPGDGESSALSATQLEVSLSLSVLMSMYKCRKTRGPADTSFI